MTIGRRIFVFQLVVGLAIAAMAGLVVVHLRSSNYFVERIQWAQRQLDATTRLAVSANRYSEQIAELLLIGEPERDDLESARRQVNEVLGELRELTTEEVAFLRRNDREHAKIAHPVCSFSVPIFATYL